MPQIRVYDAPGNVIETHEQPSGNGSDSTALTDCSKQFAVPVCSVRVVLSLRECASVRFYMTS
jgi:hypothetical protein